MSNILIINGAKKIRPLQWSTERHPDRSRGWHTARPRHDVRIVRADSDYDVKAEVQNFLWADVVIWQMRAGGWARRGQ